MVAAYASVQLLQLNISRFHATAARPPSAGRFDTCSNSHRDATHTSVYVRNSWPTSAICASGNASASVLMYGSIAALYRLPVGKPPWYTCSKCNGSTCSCRHAAHMPILGQTGTAVHCIATIDLTSKSSLPSSMRSIGTPSDSNTFKPASW